jgi:hypothetical protein
MLIEAKCIHGNDSSKCEKCLRQKNNVFAKENNKKINDEMLCIHGRSHNTCGNCIRRKNEKMKRKVTKSNSNCDNFCEHFESVELCKECLQNTKLHQDPVDFMDNRYIFNIYL